MDHAVAVERLVPGVEHVEGEAIALLLAAGLVAEERLALEPSHGEEAPGRELGHDFRDVDVRLAGQHVAVEAHVPGLEPVIQLLAQAGLDLLVDLVGVDRRVVAPVEGEDQAELGEVGLHRGLDVRVLQLAGEVAAVLALGAVDLAEGGGGRGVEVEGGEAGLPVRAELGRHAAADERAAHRRGGGLELGQLGRVLGRQRVRDGGQHLGHLHQRPFQAAERRPQLARVLAAVEVAPEQAGAGDARRLAGDGARDLGVAADPAAEPVLALEDRVGARRVAHAAPLREAGSASSSWSISRSTRPKPLPQKPGSPASRPKGASSSRWRSVPPARSRSR